MTNLSISGVYKISNTINGKFYIGSSTRISRRFLNHKNMLNSGSHKNFHLQSAWKKYGASAFSFEVLELVENKEELLNVEQKWIDVLMPHIPSIGYNICSIAGNTFGYKHTEETKRKIGEASKGKSATPAMLESLRKTNANPETRAKIRKSLIETVKSRGVKTSCSLKAKGHKPSDLALSLAAISNRKRFARRYTVTSPDGTDTLITNLSQFCRESGLHLGHMTEIAQGKRKSIHGWKCKYYAE